MSRYLFPLSLGLMLAFGGVGLKQAKISAASQKPSPAPGKATGVIKSESNLVLVDVVATDKKGNYIKDLQRVDFHVYEDEAEQPIGSFSRESDVQPGGPQHQRYMVLFFDDSTMNPSLQLQTRQVAEKFLETSVSSDRQMAVAVFGGALKIAQTFTADGELLKRAVGFVKNSSVNPNSAGASGEVVGSGGVLLGSLHSGFTGFSPLLAIRELANSLREVRGRKALILFSGGFALKSERLPELAAAIDALNKSNVAVYPVDVRGVGTSLMNLTPPYIDLPAGYFGNSLGQSPPDTVSPNEGIFHDLAKGTGGFEIFNTNDSLQGLQKVATELDEYYNLTYILPREVHDGGYHRIKVTVGRPGVVVRFRPGYFDSKRP